MANIRFLTIANLWSAGETTITGSSEAAALPVALTAQTERGKVWRSLSDIANQWAQADLGSALSVTCCAIANPKLQNAGSLKLQRSSDGSAWTDVDTFPAADVETNVTYLFFDALAYRYWRVLSVNGNGAIADYAEIGYIYLGTYFEPATNVTTPLNVKREDPSVWSSSPDGQITTTTRTAYASWANQFEAVDESDLTNFRTLFRSVGRRIPFFCVVDQSLTWSAWLCRTASELGWVARDVPGLYDVQFECWEER